MKIIDYLIRLKNSNRVAAIEKDKCITYKELFESAKIYSNIIKNNITGRNNIAILLPNSIEYIRWYYAILYSGNVVVPVYFQSSDYEICNIINKTDIALIISSSHLSEKMNGLEFTHQVKFLFYDQLSESVCLETQKQPPATKSTMETAVLLGTSGSLSNPKRVMLTDRNLVENAKDIINSLCYTKNEIFLVLLPLPLASANTSQLLTSLILSASVVIYHDIIHPDKIYECMDKYKVTSCTIVASVMRLLVESGIHEKYPLKNLKTLCFGGGPSVTEDIRKISDLYSDINIVHMYGQTEASTRITHLTKPWFKKKIGSVGKPIGNILLKVMDENGFQCPDETEGEIVVFGNNVMQGYYNQPELTAKTLRNGWLFTGDVGNLDHDGFLYITGRKKNVIISSGFNIYPEEIENIILQSRLVNDVLVYGEINSQYGEITVVKAVKKYDSVTSDKILDFCEKFLPAHKMPHRINFVDHIIKTENGKIVRRKNEYE